MKAVVCEFPPHRLAERIRFGAHQFDEFWDGVLHIPPAQTTGRQELLSELSNYLKRRWAKPRGCRVHHGVNITMPADEANWLHNFRIAEIVLLTPDRFGIDKNEYMVGPPLVVVAIRRNGGGDKPLGTRSAGVNEGGSRGSTGLDQKLGTQGHIRKPLGGLDRLGTALEELDEMPRIPTTGAAE